MMSEVFILNRTRTNCTFVMSCVPEWKVVAKRWWGFGTRRAYQVLREGNEEYVLKQTSIIKQFFAFLPIINLFFIFHVPFSFFRNGDKCGYSKRVVTWHGVYKFYFEGSCYQLTIHSKRTHSLLADGVQVAVYKRIASGKYRVNYSRSIAHRPDLLILFAAFVEMPLKEESGGTGTLGHGEPGPNWIPHDKYAAYAQWKPEDDE